MVYQRSVAFLFLTLFSYVSIAWPLEPSHLRNELQKGKPVNVQGSPKYLFITGDSWSTTKFDTAGAQPSKTNRLGNSAGTFSGGDNWVGVLANTLMPQDTLVYNYAVGGNVVNIAHVQSHADNIKSPIKDMISQVNEFEMLGHSVPWNGQNSLSITWFGINDIDFIGIDNYEKRSPYSIYGTLQLDIGDYFAQLERQYSFGVRNFIVTLAPPLSRTPNYSVSHKDQITLLTQYLSYWNDHLKTGVDDFRNKHNDIHITLFNPEPAVSSVLNNFAKFGASSNDCISNPKGEPCLWWDPIHPGIAIQKELGKAMFEVVKSMKFV